MEFQIDRLLAYQVVGSASFLFNVAAVRNSLQRVISEDFNVTGAGPAEELMEAGQRLHRVAAGSGRVELSYHAVISAQPEAGFVNRTCSLALPIVSLLTLGRR